LLKNLWPGWIKADASEDPWLIFRLKDRGVNDHPQSGWLGFSRPWGGESQKHVSALIVAVVIRLRRICKQPIISFILPPFAGVWGPRGKRLPAKNVFLTRKHYLCKKV
jgi:hypothetical protein